MLIRTSTLKNEGESLKSLKAKCLEWRCTSPFKKKMSWKVKLCEKMVHGRMKWIGKWNSVNQQKWTLGVEFLKKAPISFIKWDWGSDVCELNGMVLSWEISFVCMELQTMSSRIKWVWTIEAWFNTIYWFV